MIKKGLKNFFHSLRNVFTPLGTLDWGSGAGAIRMLFSQEWLVGLFFTLALLEVTVNVMDLNAKSFLLSAPAPQAPDPAKQPS